MVDDKFDPAVMGGSVKRGIVNPDLAEERARCDFDQVLFAKALWGQEMLDHI